MCCVVVKHACMGEAAGTAFVVAMTCIGELLDICGDGMYRGAASGYAFVSTYCGYVATPDAWDEKARGGTWTMDYYVKLGSEVGICLFQLRSTYHNRKSSTVSLNGHSISISTAILFLEFIKANLLQTSCAERDQAGLPPAVRHSFIAHSEQGGGLGI